MTISASGIGKSGHSETENYHQKIKRMQRQVEQYQDKLTQEQENLRRHLDNEDEEAAKLSRGIITQYQQMINGLEEQIASMQRKIERVDNAPEVESVEEAVLEQLAQVEELSEQREKYDTFAAGTEDPAKDIPVTYQLIQEENGSKVLFGTNR